MSQILATALNSHLLYRVGIQRGQIVILSDYLYFTTYIMQCAFCRVQSTARNGQRTV